MSDLITALGLVLVIEGVLYALFPNGMRQGLVQMLALPDGTLRTVGLAAAIAGVVIVWFVRG